MRAAALATIPLLLFVVAALPRLWAPDLVPFGRDQAMYVTAAHGRASDSWHQLYADPDTPTLAMLDPLLRTMPSPVEAWVVVRGLLDALGVALLYLAVRALLGTFPAVAAAGLYAASPIAWSAARDPSGALGPMLGAASLLAAVRMVERPSPVRGAVLGIALGLLTRSLPIGLLVVALGVVTLAQARVSWRAGGVTALALVLTAGPSLFTSPSVLLIPLPPPAVIESRPLIFNPLPPLLLLGAAIWGLWMVQRRPGIAFCATWLIVGFLGSDWIYQCSHRSGASNQIVTALVGMPGHVRLFLPIAVLSVALMSWDSVGARRVGRIAALMFVVALGAGIGLDMRSDAEAEWSIPPFMVGGGYSTEQQATRARASGSFFQSPSLREVAAMTDAVREAAGRANAPAVVLLRSVIAEAYFSWADGADLDALQTRSVGTSLVLPLERETVYLASAINPEAAMPWLPIEAQRPSSAVSVFTPAGADTGARIFTIRPRPLADWLARVHAIPDGRFADGSVLLGVNRASRPEGVVELTLYWQIPAAADGRTLGSRAQVLVDGVLPRTRSASGLALMPTFGEPFGSARFPPIEARRGGELIVQLVRLAAISTDGRMPTLSVAVYDDRGQQVRTVAGGTEVALPAGQ